jgi:CheY-like chemotaxis protein
MSDLPGGREEGIRVLLVEDNPGDARLVELTLEHEPGGPYPLEVVGRIGDALRRLERPGIDVILLDRGLPDSHEWEGLGEIRTKAPRVPIVVLTGSVEARFAYEALEKGAQDYHMKGVFPGGVLGGTLSSAIVRHRTEDRLAQGRELDPKLVEALGRLHEGVALLEGRTVMYVNPALTEITGSSREEIRQMPEWMDRFVDGGTLGAAADPGGGPAPKVNRGDFVLDRKDGTTVDIEYVAKSFGRLPTRRTFLWMRIVASIGAPSPVSAVTSDPAVIHHKTTSSRREPRSSVRPQRPVSEASIDPAAWKRLIDLSADSNVFLTSLVERFRAEGRDLLDRLESSSRSEDPKAIRSVIHTFASSSSQVGAFPLRRILDRLQDSVTGPAQGTEVLELIRDAGREFHRAEAALEELQIAVSGPDEGLPRGRP